MNTDTITPPQWIKPAGGFAPEGSGLYSHPVFALPSRGQWEAARGSEEVREQVKKYLQQRQEQITAEQQDLWNNCWIPETWKASDMILEQTPFLALFGGNRPGKTTWAVRKAIEVLSTRAKHGKPANVLILHESEKTSIRLHHARMWEHFPLAWRATRKSRLTNIKYDVKNGFSGNVFTVNGAVCTFGNYGQQVDQYEGLEYDLIVFDEKAPLDWVQRLLRGITTRAGKIIWAYTAIDGVTPAVNEVLAGARTLVSQPIVDPDILSPDERHVEDCPVGHMPYLQKSPKFGAYIIYFPSHSNPYGGYDELKELYGKESKDVRERRFYGYARKLIKACFPKFGEVNVITRERWLGMVGDGDGDGGRGRPREGETSLPLGTGNSATKNQAPGSKNLTRYHIMDPAGTRNMFQLWVAVDANGYHYVYDEWPDYETMGAWATASSNDKRWDGDLGPAQQGIGYGVADYKHLMLSREGNRLENGQWIMGGDDIYERFIDPRSGKQETVAENSGGMSLIDRFAEDQEDYSGNLVGPGMDLIPAPGLLESEGLSAINNLLAWKPDQPMVSLMNEPRLYVVENCQNLIWALQNYTGHDGEKAACKDPIDCLRYAATAELTHVAKNFQPVRGGGSY